MSNFVTLLVEDDAFQREIIADVLKDEGFEVVECATAEAAELIIASTGTELRALITDPISRPSETIFLQKPFSPDRLLEAVR